MTDDAIRPLLRRLKTVTVFFGLGFFEKRVKRQRRGGTRPRPYRLKPAQSQAIRLRKETRDAWRENG